MIKLGKEFKGVINTFKTKVGTTNRLETKSVYVILTAWVSPEDVDTRLDYASRVNKYIRQYVHTNMSKRYNFYDRDKTIVSVSLSTSGMKRGKRGFLNCEISLAVKEFDFSTNKKSLESVANEIVQHLEKNPYGLSFHYDKL